MHAVDLEIDASDSEATKLHYIIPDNIPIDRATLWYGSNDTGWNKWDEKTSITGSSFLIFDQTNIDLISFGDTLQEDRNLKLELQIAGQSSEFLVNTDRVERLKTATELITGFWIDVGARVFNHIIIERYNEMLYSITASGELRQLASSFSSVNLGSSDFSAGTESHKYNPDGGAEQEMIFNENTIGGSPYLVSWSLTTQSWIDTSITTVDKGVCKNSGINVFTGTGPAIGGSTNNSVDVTID